MCYRAFHLHQKWWQLYGSTAYILLTTTQFYELFSLALSTPNHISWSDGGPFNTLWSNTRSWYPFSYPFLSPSSSADRTYEYDYSTKVKLPHCSTRTNLPQVLFEPSIHESKSYPKIHAQKESKKASSILKYIGSKGILGVHTHPPTRTHARTHTHTHTHASAQARARTPLVCSLTQNMNLVKSQHVGNPGARFWDIPLTSHTTICARSDTAV